MGRMWEGERRLVTLAAVATWGIGTFSVGIIILLALVGDRTSLGEFPVRVNAVMGVLTMVVLWCALAVIVHEVIAAREDNITKGTAIPTLLGGLMALVALAFFLVVYRAMFYALSIFGFATQARLLTDPVLLSVLNIILFAFAVTALIFVANAPARALIREGAGRRGKKNSNTEEEE